MAKRVLPAPPGPVSVSRRVRSSIRPSSASSRWRPTKLVDNVGRLCGHDPGSGAPPTNSRRYTAVVSAAGATPYDSASPSRRRSKAAAASQRRPVAASATSSDRCTSSSSGRSDRQRLQQRKGLVGQSVGHQGTGQVVHQAGSDGVQPVAVRRGPVLIEVLGQELAGPQGEGAAKVLGRTGRGSPHGRGVEVVDVDGHALARHRARRSRRGGRGSRRPPPCGPHAAPDGSCWRRPRGRPRATAAR